MRGSQRGKHDWREPQGSGRHIPRPEAEPHSGPADWCQAKKLMPVLPAFPMFKKSEIWACKRNLPFVSIDPYFFPIESVK